MANEVACPGDALNRVTQMSLIRIPLLSLLFVLLMYSHNVTGDERFPERLSHVNDFAGLLSQETKDQLEKVLDDFYEETTHDVLIATFHSYGDEPKESFMTALADEWKIGYKDLANGVIVAIFEHELQAGIEVGLGLRDKITLHLQHDMIQSHMAPYFRRKDYDSGILNAIPILLQRIEPEYEIPIASERSGGRKAAAVIGLVIVLIVTLAVDGASYSGFQRSIRKTRGYVYWRETGRYSFLEWWLLYGTIPTTLEWIYLNVILRWINPSFIISSQGTKTAFFQWKTGGGRFFGSGNSGKW